MVLANSTHDTLVVAISFSAQHLLHKRTHAHACTDTYAHAYIHRHTHIHTHIHTHTRARTHTHICTRIRTHIGIYTHCHIYKYKYIYDRHKTSSQEGPSFWSDCLVASTSATPPGYPSAANVVSVSRTSATLSWSLPEDDGGAGISYHAVGVACIICACVRVCVCILLCSRLPPCRGLNQETLVVQASTVMSAKCVMFLCVRVCMHPALFTAASLSWSLPENDGGAGIRY